MAGDIQAAQKRLNAKVMGRDGVSGTAIGMKNGSPCLKVYLTGTTKPSIPKKVDGFPVVVETTGSFRRL